MIIIINCWLTQIKYSIYCQMLLYLAVNSKNNNKKKICATLYVQYMHLYLEGLSLQNQYIHKYKSRVLH